MAGTPLLITYFIDKFLRRARIKISGSLSFKKIKKNLAHISSNYIWVWLWTWFQVSPYLYGDNNTRLFTYWTVSFSFFFVLDFVIISFCFIVHYLSKFVEWCIPSDQVLQSTLLWFHSSLLSKELSDFCLSQILSRGYVYASIALFFCILVHWQRK